MRATLAMAVVVAVAEAVVGTKLQEVLLGTKLQEVLLGNKLVLLFPVVILALAARIFHFGRARGRDARPPRSRGAECTAEYQQCRAALPAPERGSAPAPCPAAGHRHLI